MWTEELSLKIFKIIDDRKLWYRVVALDLETKVLMKEDFLTCERILGISIARRQSSNKIDNERFVLDDETDKKEAELLRKLDDLLLKWKPLVIVGYGSRGYDLPLLAMKRAFFYNRKDIAFLGISNILNGSAHIELGDLARYIFFKKYKEDRTFRDMNLTMKHKHFKDLLFINTKDIYDLPKEQKGIEIYKSWKSGDEKFKKYLKGEAHDQLLIAEKIRDTEF
ncbi:MAG: hypothetical protein GPJ52_00725 [Candidatus Heimdallarchaeota archaeon]|nr:hypothetical protein [Candidatus Heimdallarchaeota archaeon]